LIEVLDRRLLQPGHGAHGIVRLGQTFRIIDELGEQVFDFASFSLDDPHECADLVMSRVLLEKWKLEVNDQIVSSALRPMWTVIGDSTGVHEWSGGYCSRGLNRALGYEHDGCKEVMEQELTAAGLQASLLTSCSCLNSFMNIPYESSGRWKMRRPVSRAGDYLELRAEMDIFWIGAVCTMEEPANGWPLTPIACELRTPGSSAK